MKIFRQIALLGLLVSIPLKNLYAQDQPPSGEIEDVQVIIEKDKPLTLPKANRVYEKTQIKTIQRDTVSLRFEPSQPKYEFEGFKPSFQPAKYQETAEANYKYDHYVKAGFGNYQSPLLAAYYNVSDRDNFLGLWFRHESFGKGPVRDEASAFSSNRFALDGNYQARYLSVKPILNYKREGFYYYGYDDLAYRASSQNFSDRYFQERSIFQDFNVGAALTVPGDGWDVGAEATYERTGMNIKGLTNFNEENVLRLGVNSGYSFTDNFQLNTGINYAWAQYGGSSDTFTRSKLEFAPGVQTSISVLDVEAGIKLVSASDSSTNLYVYPDIEILLPISDNSSIKAIINGDLEMNTLASVYAQNRYLDDTLALMNTNKALNIQGVFQSQLSSAIRVSGFAGYEIIKNQLLFNYSRYDSSRFQAVYDQNFGRFHFGGSGAYYFAGKGEVSASYTYYAYKEGTEEVAWFLPSTKLQIDARYEFVKNLHTSLGFTALGGLKAPYVVESTPTNEAVYRTFKSVFDLSLGAEYYFKENMAVYCSFDNLLGQEYERYLNYPVRGLTAKFGFIFHF